MLRIGLLTSGGDCQALNATMRGIVKTLDYRSGEIGRASCRERVYVLV